MQKGMVRIALLRKTNASRPTGESMTQPNQAAPLAIAPAILDYLGDLETAVAQLANTWKPDDPNYRADVYRQIMMNLSYAYFVYFHADPEHPDWVPMFNPVFMQQPNPDTLYVYAPLRGDLTYRVSGRRGTCHSLVFSTLHGVTGAAGTFEEFRNINTFDVKDMAVAEDGEIEIVFSAERPAGYTGNWSPILPDTDTMMVRYVSLDWANEIDPQLSIECLDRVPMKPRLTAEQIIERIRSMAKVPGNMDRLFFWQQDDVKQRLGVNRFELQLMTGVEFQYYWPAAFEFLPGEALIIETELPEIRPYWNLQLNDPYFNAVDYVYRLSCTNAHYAQVSSDGKFRAVVALEDPGVPNWLDTGGFTEGTLWGRWYDCSTTPLPTIKRVQFDQLREHLPDDTPVVTADQRVEELRERVRACQRRRRW
jgi:hypothetical protein